MTFLILANGLSLIVDKLHLVRGDPLVYVSFLALIIAVVWISYLKRIQKIIASVGKVTVQDRLSALHIVALGFPRDLSKNHLEALRYRYSLLARLAMLAAFITLGALVFHYLTMPQADIERKLGKLEKISTRLDEIETARLASQAKFESTMQRYAGLVGELRILTIIIDDDAATDPKLRRCVEELSLAIRRFDSDYAGIPLQPEQDFRFRLAKATAALCNRRSEEALALIQTVDATQERDRTANQIMQEVELNRVRGTALLSIGLPKRALECFERIFELQSDQPICLYVAGLCAMELFDHPKAYDYFLRSLNSLKGREQVATFDKPFEKDCLEASVLQSLGEASIGLGKSEEGFSFYTQSFEVLSNLPDSELEVRLAWATAFFNRGSAYLQNSDVKKAFDDFDSALPFLDRVGSNRTDMITLRTAIYINQAAAWRGCNNHARAAQSYYLACEYLSSMSSIATNTEAMRFACMGMTGIALSLQAVGKNTEAASVFLGSIKSLDQIKTSSQRIKNDKAALLLMLGECLCAMKQYEDSLRCLQQAKKILIDIENMGGGAQTTWLLGKALLAESIVLRELKQPIEALSALALADSHFAQNSYLSSVCLKDRASCYEKRADLFISLGEYASAMQEATTAIDLLLNDDSLLPDLARSFRKRASIWKDLGQQSMAIKDVDAALLELSRKSHREDTHEFSGDLACTLVIRAQFYEDNKQFEKALTDLNLAIRIIWSVVHSEGQCEFGNVLAGALLGQAQLYHRFDRHSQAMDSYDSAIKEWKNWIASDWGKPDDLPALAFSLACRAELLRDGGNLDLAIVALGEAESVMCEAPNSRNAPLLSSIRALRTSINNN